MNRRILVAAVILAAASLPALAQTKAETKLYSKTLAKPSLTAYDKFLKKYPSSVYSDDISARKDTLLNITPYSEQQAADIIAPLLPDGAEFKAIADRREAVDRIYGVCINADTLSLDRVRVYTATLEKGEWKLSGSYEAPSVDAGDMASRSFVDATSVFTIRGIRYLRFNYLMSSADKASQTYVAAYYAPQTDEFGSVAFTGKNTLRNGSDLAYEIYGRSNKNMISNIRLPQMALLSKDIDENAQLKVIPESEYLTDAAIEWWTSKNPELFGNEKSLHLSFLIIQKESSLVQEFERNKKKSSSKYNAAMFDINGYTVIVVYQKAGDNYVLAWVEPECKDHYKDRLLNSISFDDANVISLNYYHGNRTYKYRLNLASHDLRK